MNEPAIHCRYDAIIPAAEVECPDGKRLLKKRDRLKLTRAEAEEHLERLCRR